MPAAAHRLFKQQTPQLIELIFRTRKQERDSFAGHDDGAGYARLVIANCFSLGSLVKNEELNGVYRS
jgi:hypothetical protein